MCGTRRMHGFCVHILYTSGFCCLQKKLPLLHDCWWLFRPQTATLQFEVESTWPKKSYFIYICIYLTQESTWGSPTVLNSSCQTLSRNRCVVLVCERHAEVLQLPHISPKPPCYSGSQWGVRALETLVELVSEEIINSSVMLTVFSKTCMPLENFYA